MIYTTYYNIELDDIGRDEKATNRSIMKIMQETAVLHSEYIGYGLLNMEEKEKAWMVLDWEIKVIERPLYNTKVKAQTWGRRIDRLSAYRDFKLEDEEGNTIAIATSKWVFVDIQKRKPTRITEDIKNLFEIEPDKKVLDKGLEKIKRDDYNFDKEYKEYKVERRDIDINGHMNNLAYIDMAYEILPEEVYQNKVFNNIRITYKKEIVYGESIEYYYAEQGNKSIIEARKKDEIKSLIELY